MRPCLSNHIFLNPPTWGVQCVRDGPERSYARQLPREGLIDIELIDHLNDISTRVHDLNILVNLGVNARHGRLMSICRLNRFNF
jgi:hypothetical protein